jgi:hypothetical protein
MVDETRRQTILAKLRLYQDAVRKILLHEWDPIGIGELGPQDEYDTYVDQVCAKLMHRAGRDELATYLWRAESEDMGMPGTREHIDNVVSHLLRIRDEIEQENP